MIRKNERGPSPKEGKERANTTMSSVTANKGGLYQGGQVDVRASLNATQQEEEEEENGLPQTEDVAILAKHPSAQSRNRYMTSTNPNEDASMVEVNMNATVTSEKPGMFGTF